MTARHRSTLRAALLVLVLLAAFLALVAAGSTLAQAETRVRSSTVSAGAGVQVFRLSAARLQLGNGQSHDGTASVPVLAAEGTTDALSGATYSSKVLSQLKGPGEYHSFPGVVPLAAAEEVLNLLANTTVIVLGGDFWRYDETGRLRPSHERWYVEKVASESEVEFSRRSIKRALEEVTRRAHMDDWRVVLVGCEAVGV